MPDRLEVEFRTIRLLKISFIELMLHQQFKYKTTKNNPNLKIKFGLNQKFLRVNGNFHFLRMANRLVLLL